MHQAQATPREPTFDQSMHKPSSLYPSKRTRTDSGWDGQDSDRKVGQPSPGSASFLMNYQSERNKSQQQQLPTPTCGSPDTYSYRYTADHVDDRLPIREPLGHYACSENRGRTAHALASPGLGLPVSYEHQHSSQAHYPGQQRSDNDVRLSTGGRESVTMHSRSPSLTTGEERSQRAALVGRPDVLQPRFRSDSTRHSLLPAANSPSHRDGYPGMNHLGEAASFNPPSYPYSQNAFFVPSHYEYQNGKSRKRSNLPKQSTEIMKRWFGKAVTTAIQVESC